MNPVIFREYDIRGIVHDQFTVEESYAIGRAILTYYLEQKPDLTTIILGMDGRTHSPAIKKYILQAAADLGLTVIDIGVCPTPVFYFAVFTLSEANSGIMITASHNPGEYNGFKLCLGKKTVWGNQIRQIAQHVESNVQPGSAQPAIQQHAIIDDYIAWLCEHFSALKGIDLPVVIDCGNGTAGTVYPQLIEAMGWQNATLLYEEVDGTFPNHEADPTVERNMLDVKAYLHEHPTVALGIGLDGDCDRMTPMTSSGYLLAGDELLAIYSQQILKDIPNAPIVYDVKSSAGLINSLAGWGARGHISPCGHAIIKEHMYSHGAMLAGELSCHFFFNDRYFGYDDGIYASLRLLEIVINSDQSLDEMVNVLPKHISSREYRITCAEEEKVDIVSSVSAAFKAANNAKLITIDGVRVEKDYGWGLIRASNTQAALSLRFESSTEEGLEQIKKDFTHILQGHIDPQTLKDHFDT